MLHRSLLHLLIPALAALAAPGMDAAVTADGNTMFKEKIEPILREHCFKCHSHADNKMKGGLVLDSRDALLEGGDSGPALVPGDPAKSLLVEAVRYENPDLQMPPKGKKLAPEQIDAIAEWVKAGAPWPESDQKLTARPKGKITDEDRQWWAIQPLAKVDPPKLEGSGNEIDGFIRMRLKQEGLKPAPPAAPHQLIRRLYFDLIGVPPAPEEVARFVRDYERSEAANRQEVVNALIDRLLADPRYGERWARHWLDLVRYAESDGYRLDSYREHAWRYRDYVIQSFNSDKPYDRFVKEQLAGDELYPNDLDARVATGFLRHWIYEYNSRDAVGQWDMILNDITDVAGDVFLGVGVQCARCHDHKFDPVLQTDYFRLRAFFAPLIPRDDQKLATEEQIAAHEAQMKVWEEKTAHIREQMRPLEELARARGKDAAVTRFPPDIQALFAKPAEQQTPYEKQIADLVWRQIYFEWEQLLNHLKGAEKETLIKLQKQLSAFDAEKPAPLPPVITATDVGPEAPPTKVPKRDHLGEIVPGVLTILDEGPLPVKARDNSTGRRAALAEWLTQPDNPLTTRVIVNRVWQYHFGRGLVGTSSDFGRLGDKPSHPDLLDWLAQRFVANGWSFKKLHRLILTSATYQQSAFSTEADKARLIDPENRLLWRANSRRLDAEEIRDAILAVTGELNPKAGGPSERPDRPRRTIYTRVMRNTVDPLLEAFDVPDNFASTSQRKVTTTPTQSLLMLNSEWTLARAQAFARRLERENSSDEGEIIGEAFRLAFGREATEEEITHARAFIARQTRMIEPPKEETKPVPFVTEKMPFRDGRAAVMKPGTAQDRLIVPDHPAFPSQDFTVEAFVVLNSLYNGGEVRTIASQWSGRAHEPGWSFGITGKQSRYKPQTLVLLLRGDKPWKSNDPVEPIFSGLHLELGRPYFVAASVKLGNTSETGITFYAKDLSNDDQPIQVANVKHSTTSGIRSHAPFVIGARNDDRNHVFDGLIDDVRLSNVALPQESLLLNNVAVTEHTVGFWRFENEAGVFKDASATGRDIQARIMETPKHNPRLSALADFCHALLNANEFIYLD